MMKKIAMGKCPLFWFFLLLILATVNAGAAPRASLAKAAFAPADLMETRLTVSQRGYFSLQAKSATGTGLALIDRMAGVLGKNGSAGKQDGRIDLLLDPGEYKISLLPDPQSKGNVELNLHSFTEINPGQTLADYPFLYDGDYLETTLGDLETRSYWIYLEEKQELRLEIMGRALKTCLLWQNGQWLTPIKPTIKTYEPVSGRPMLYAEFHHQLEPGHYLLVCAAGPPQAWASENKEIPLFVRRGAPFLGTNGMKRLVISPFGRDSLLVSGEANYFECVRDTVQDTRLSVGAFRAGTSRFSSLASSVINKESKEPWCKVTRSGSGDRQWLIVEASPGDAVEVSFFRRGTEYSFYNRRESKSYWVSTITSYAGRNLLDVTPILYQSGKNITFLRETAIRVGPGTPLIRKFNLFGYNNIFLYIEEPGTYRFAESAQAGAKAKYRLTLLEDRWLRGTSSNYYTPDKSVELVRGYYMLELDPLSLGILHTAFYKEGTQNPDQLLKKPVPETVHSFTWPKIQVPADTSISFITNSRYDLASGLDVRELPISLSVPLSAYINAGESVEISVKVEKESLLYLEGKKCLLTVSGKRAENKAPLAPGTYTIAVKNESGETDLISLYTLDKKALQRFPKPVLKSFEETFAVFEETKPHYADFDRGQTIDLLLRVKEPALYRIETTGRLSMGLAVRTPLVTSLWSVRENGTGRNARIESYLRPGDYLVSVTATGKSKGRAGVVLKKTPFQDEGSLPLDVLSRKTVEPDVGLRYRLMVSEKQEYSITTFGLGMDFIFRLEDRDGFPLALKGTKGTTLELAPGDYYYYSLPVPFVTRRLTRFEISEKEAPAPIGKEYTLVLNSSVKNVWKETPERNPDVYRILISAPLSVSVSLSAGMEGEFVPAQQGDPVHLIGGRQQNLDLAPGAYEIRVKASEVRYLFGYSISVDTQMLAPGLSYEIGSLPASFVVSTPGNDTVDLWSFGSSDIKASLWDEKGQTLVAENDDTQDDWNFRITQRLPAGRYLLQIEQAGFASGDILISMATSPRSPLAQETLPFTLEKNLGKEIVVIPVRPETDGIFNVMANEGRGIKLALYRGERLLAEADSALFIPLIAGTTYSLHIWQSGDAPQKVKILASLGIMRETILPGQAATIECPPFLLVKNPLGLSYKFSDKNNRLLFSPGPETPCLPLGRFAQNTAGDVGYLAVQDGRPLSELRVEPLMLTPNRKETVFLGAISHSFLCTPSDDSIYLAIVESQNPGTGAMILPKSSFNKDKFLWRGMESGLLKTYALLPMGGAYQGKLWNTGSGGTAQRTDITLKAFPVLANEKMKLSGTKTFTIGAQKGVRIYLPAGEFEVRLLLASACLAASWNANLPEAMVVAETENRDVRFTVTGGVLFIVNNGSKNALASVEILEARPQRVLALQPEGLETYPQAPGTITLSVPGGKTEEMLCLAGDDVTAVLRGHDGKIFFPVAAATPPSLLLFPASKGDLEITHGSGFLKVFIAPKNLEPDVFAGRPAALSARPLAPRQACEGKQELYTFAQKESGFVEISSTASGLIALFKDNRVLSLSAGSDGRTKKILYYCQPGTYEVYSRPLHDIAQSGVIRFRRIGITGLNSSNSNTLSFIGPDDIQIFEFSVREKSMVGVGLAVEDDRLSASLYSPAFEKLGEGALMFRELEKGNYFLVVSGASIPVQYRPVIYGTEESITSTPKEIIDQYKNTDQNYSEEGEE